MESVPDPYNSFHQDVFTVKHANFERVRSVTQILQP